MEKKRRKSVELVSSLENTIGSVVNTLIVDGITITKYNVRDEYGTGEILVYKFKGVLLSIRKFSLKQDLLITAAKHSYVAQLSFLVSGEVFFYQKDEEESVYESQEAYISNLNKFKGVIKLSSRQKFYEINIKLSHNYLKRIGCDEYFTKDNIKGRKCVLPLRADVLNILSELDQIAYKGLSKVLFINAKIQELLALQINDFEFQKRRGDSYNFTYSALKKVYKVKGFITKNLQCHYSIASLAKIVGLNEYELKQEFKLVVGTSINKFEREIKMKKAKDLLKISNMPIYEIAEFVGYKNATHFSAAFKKYYGKNPKEIRNNL